MRGRIWKLVMVILVLIPVGLTAYLAKSLYQRKGVPEALENLTHQLFKSKADEHKAEQRAKELERKTAELQNAYDALVSGLQGEMDSKEVRVRRFKESLEINFVDKVLFDSGSAEVTPHGRDVLAKVAGVLVKVKDKSIYVVGHTDPMPIHTPLFPSNWELSTARSAAVIRFLSESGGVAPERFMAMGRAFYQPVASNDTPDGRRENRRVDVIVAEVPLFDSMARGEAVQGTDGAGAGQAPGDATPDKAGQTPPAVRGPVNPEGLPPASLPGAGNAASSQDKAATPTPATPATPPATGTSGTPAPQTPANVPASATPAPQTAATPNQAASQAAPQPSLPPALPARPTSDAPSGS